MNNITKVKAGHNKISGFNLRNNPVYSGPWDTLHVEHSRDLNLYFESEEGGNGIAVSSLLSVIVDHLEQIGTNINAKSHISAALEALMG